MESWGRVVRTRERTVVFENTDGKPSILFYPEERSELD